MLCFAPIGDILFLVKMFGKERMFILQNTERLKISDGIFLNKITESKFTTNLISIGFICPLSEQTAGMSALLPDVLRRGCAKYPAMHDIEYKLAELYGARIEPCVRKKGDAVWCGFICDVLEEAFVPQNSELLKNLVSLLCQILTDPITSGNAFDKEYVESEKSKLCEKITAEISNKRSYSIKRMLEIMCEGEPFAVSQYGTVESVSAITAAQLFDYHASLVKSAPIEIFCCGRIPTGQLSEYFADCLSGVKREQIKAVPQTSLHKFGGDVKNVTEEMDVIQGKLSIGFDIGTSPKDELYPAMMVANGVFGSGTASKLFLNVREKMSLCYYASSYIDKLKGIMVVASGINSKDFDAAKNEILHQLQEVKNGNISDDEMKNAKTAIVSALMAMQDSMQSQEDFGLSEFIGGYSLPAEELIEKINAVGKDDVIRAAQKITLDTVYFLKGKDAEENE